MTLNIHCVGLSQSGLAGCGIVLLFMDAVARTQRREFYYGLHNSDETLAEIQAARLALASVGAGSRSAPTTIHTQSLVVANLLTKPALAAAPELSRATAEIRRWYSYYRRIEVVVAAARDEFLSRAYDLAQQGMSTQKHWDSGTTTVPPNPPPA